MDMDFLSGSRMKKYRDKVEQKCLDCNSDVLAIRINGFYSGSRERIFLWECPLCANICVSRKNKNKRTSNRYKRSKVRGSGSGARPKMRRELGAGGKRPMRSRWHLFFLSLALLHLSFSCVLSQPPYSFLSILQIGILICHPLKAIYHQKKKWR